MRQHPTRTRLTRVTRYPTRAGQLSRRATLILGVAVVIATLLITYL
ncbi:MAG: hypothetical protein ACRYFZ_21770 [Janthinobacterium lividum]